MAAAFPTYAVVAYQGRFNVVEVGRTITTCSSRADAEAIAEALIHHPPAKVEAA